MTHRTLLLAAACAYTFALAACGSDNGDATGAVAELPADSAASEQAAAAREFPLPFPDGGTIITDGRQHGSGGHITVGYPADRHRAIVDFYDDYTDETSGWKRSEAGQGEVPSVNYLNLQQGWNISVAPPVGDRMLVTLTVS